MLNLLVTLVAGKVYKFARAVAAINSSLVRADGRITSSSPVVDVPLLQSRRQDGWFRRLGVDQSSVPRRFLMFRGRRCRQQIPMVVGTN